MTQFPSGPNEVAGQMDNIKCEKVICTKGNDTNSYLIQYGAAQEQDKAECMRYLADCGWILNVEPCSVVGPQDEPAVSWANLSDILEPRDI